MKKVVSALLCICILCSLFAMTAAAADVITDVQLVCNGSFTVGEQIEDLGLSAYPTADYEIKGCNILSNSGDGWEMVDLEKHPNFEMGLAYRYELWIYSNDAHLVFSGSTLPTMSVPDFCTVSDLSVREDGSLYFNLDLGIPKIVPPSMFFNDVHTDDWFYHDVEFVYYNMMMNGVGDGNFDPNGTCTRAMVVTVLYRLLGEPGGAVPCPFTDVPEDKWYTQAVKWAANAYVVNGMTPTTFEPDTPITREQFAAILYRFAYSLKKELEGGAMLAGFSDSSAISEYAYTPLSWAFGHGIIAGEDNEKGKFLRPQDNASRCQIAAILHRFYEEYKPFQ